VIAVPDYGAFRRHIWALPFELGMAIGAIATFVTQNWLHFAASVFTLTISFAPLWMERLLKIRLPPAFQWAYVAFIFCSMFSGEVLRFYARVFGWDAVVHLVSGMLLVFAVALALHQLRRHSVKIDLPLGLRLMVMFSMAMTIALFWELIEFASDQIFGTTSQDESLFDTMTDLVLGTAGSALVTGAYFLHIKGFSVPILSRAIMQFDRLNR
jgi:hypothetical protein